MDKNCDKYSILSKKAHVQALLNIMYKYFIICIIIYSNNPLYISLWNIRPRQNYMKYAPLSFRGAYFCYLSSQPEFTAAGMTGYFHIIRNDSVSFPFLPGQAVQS